MCILDNDELLYEYYNSFELLTQIDQHPNQFENLDLIECLSPVRCGFREINTTPDRVLRYWTFEKQYRGVIQRFAIYKNLKKYYNDEIYYNDRIFNEFKCQEDTEFGCHLTLKGYNVVRCNQLIEKHLHYEKSTIFIDTNGESMNQDTRPVIERNVKNKIIHKYSYLTLSPEGNLKVKYRPATIHNKNIYGVMRGGKVTSWAIPRTIPYNIPDNLVWKPKVKETGKKKLI